MHERGSDQASTNMSRNPGARRSDPVPDGRYRVLIQAVEMADPDEAGSPVLKWTLRILGPTSAGRLLFRDDSLASKEDRERVRWDLFLAGLPLKDLSDLRGRLEELLDARMLITKRTRGSIETIYFNKKIVDLEDPHPREPAVLDRQPIGSAMAPL